MSFSRRTLLKGFAAGLATIALAPLHGAENLLSIPKRWQPPPSMGTHWYVNSNADLTQYAMLGKTSVPFPSVKVALRVAIDGDTINVHPDHVEPGGASLEITQSHLTIVGQATEDGTRPRFTFT